MNFTIKCSELSKFDEFALSHSRISKSFQDENITVYVLDNIRLNRQIERCQNIAEFIEKDYFNYLDYGLMFVRSKDSLIIYNDIYGCFPLFHASEPFNAITTDIGSWNDFVLDEYAVIDFFLFHHFLSDSTLNQHLRRIPGGSRIEITDEKIVITEKFSWQDLRESLLIPRVETCDQILLKHLDEALIDRQSILTLTGGFDSRLLFAAQLNREASFETITWGEPKNIQSRVAKDLSERYSVTHTDVVLDESFRSNIERILYQISRVTPESPFLIDVPQFAWMCEKLPENTRLITGFMGSEIIRGPSYSSQVTLTEFAANIMLSRSVNQIRSLLLEFNTEYQIFEESYWLRHIDKLIDRYKIYSRIGISESLKNENMFRYLFYEKYAKIYSQFIKIHFENDVIILNPYMDINFIARTFQERRSFSFLTPFENGSYKNFLSYRIYALLIRKLYPQLVQSSVDRGYLIHDLLSVFGFLKLIPLQILRKIRKKFRRNVIKTVDSFSWYEDIIKNTPVSDKTKMLLPFLRHDNLILHSQNMNNLSELKKLQIILYLGLNRTISDIENDNLHSH